MTCEGLEPPTPSLSRKCSPTELTSRNILYGDIKLRPPPCQGDNLQLANRSYNNVLKSIFLIIFILIIMSTFFWKTWHEPLH